MNEDEDDDESDVERRVPASFAVFEEEDDDEEGSSEGVFDGPAQEDADDEDAEVAQLSAISHLPVQPPSSLLTSALAASSKKSSASTPMPAAPPLRAATPVSSVPPTPSGSTTPTFASMKIDPLLSVRRVLICSNVLPIRLWKDAATETWRACFDREGSFEDGRLLSSLLELDSEMRIVFVGVPPINVPPKERPDVEALLETMNVYPVFPPALEASYHFQAVVRSSLHPAFHNIIDLYNTIPIQGPLQDEGGPARFINTSAEDERGEWLPTKSWNPMDLESLWPAHLSLLSRFRKEIVSLYSEGDVVWVFDTSMIMLVGQLRHHLPDGAPIGIFLHTPFPSSEVFRCIPKREDLLESLLSADHVGFHAFEYARHLMTCAQRISGFAFGSRRGGTNAISTSKGRTVVLSCLHAGLDSEHVQAALLESYDETPDPVVARLLSTASRGHRHAKIIVGVDEVEGLRGLALKLLAFDRCLMNVPEFRNGAVRLIQVGLILASRPDDFVKSMMEVRRLVDQVNGKWGKDTIIFEEVSSFSLKQRMALYARADVMWNSCIRWGLSGDAFEFITAQRHRADAALQEQASAGGLSKGEPGVCVLSEFMACSRVLSGSLRTNPWSLDDSAKAVETACKMTLPEKIARVYRDASFVEGTSCSEWARSVLRDVVSASTSSSMILGVGMGGAMRAVGKAESKLRFLNVQKLRVAYASSSKRRLLIFDYAGTLVATTPNDVFIKSGGQARSWHYANAGGELCRREGGGLETRDPVSPEVIQVLKGLCEDPRNIVAVCSTDLRDELEHAMEAVGPALTLIAENGFAVKLGSTVASTTLSNSPNLNANKWVSVFDQVDDGGDWYGGEHEDEEDWRPLVASLFRIFVARTNGAFVFVAPSSVSFNYALADPEHGENQAKTLTMELEQMLAGLPVLLERGKGFLTVRQAGVNRGAAITGLVRELGLEIDFAMGFGDDMEDESMFKAVASEIPGLNPKYAFPCRVGLIGTPDETKAKYFVHDDSDVLDIMETLCQCKDTIAPAVAKSYINSTGVGFKPAKTAKALASKGSGSQDSPKATAQVSPAKLTSPGASHRSFHNNHNNNAPPIPQRDEELQPAPAAFPPTGRGLTSSLSMPSLATANPQARVQSQAGRAPQQAPLPATSASVLFPVTPAASPSPAPASTGSGVGMGVAVRPPLPSPPKPAAAAEAEEADPQDDAALPVPLSALAGVGVVTLGVAWYLAFRRRMAAA